MSTWGRSLSLDFRVVSLTLCHLDVWAGHVQSSPPDPLCTSSTLLCALWGWPLWAASTTVCSSGLCLGLANGELCWDIRKRGRRLRFPPTKLPQAGNAPRQVYMVSPDGSLPFFSGLWEVGVVRSHKVHIFVNSPSIQLLVSLHIT